MLIISASNRNKVLPHAHIGACKSWLWKITIRNSYRSRKGFISYNLFLWVVFVPYFDSLSLFICHYFFQFNQKNCWVDCTSIRCLAQIVSFQRKKINGGISLWNLKSVNANYTYWFGGDVWEMLHEVVLNPCKSYFLLFIRKVWGFNLNPSYIPC